MARKTPKPDTCRLTVTIRGTAYTARPVRPETPDVIRAWTLRRPDGETYTVADTDPGAVCTCADFVYRHDCRDQSGCKHIRAMRALELIDGDGTNPGDWPAWTDTHAYTVAH